MKATDLLLILIGGGVRMNVGKPKIAVAAIGLVIASSFAFAHQSSSAQRGSINDPQASTNASVVNFRADCPGLFIPRVFETRFRGMIPSYAMYVVNKSDKRYSVKYDMVYTQSGRGPFARGTETRSQEKSFNIRPNTMVEFTIADKAPRSSSYVVTSIDEIDVFECVGR